MNVRRREWHVPQYKVCAMFPSSLNSQNTNSGISYKQPREWYCTEIVSARRIVKNRLTALSFTTGLVIRISHDEERGSTQPEAIH